MLMRLGLTLLLLLFCFHQPAHGHKLLLMAWLEGDRLMVEAAFGDGTMAAHAHITVLDAVDGETLLSDQADAGGLLEITLPEALLTRDTPLLIRAGDGAGHLAEHVIGMEEIRQARPSASAVRSEPAVIPEGGSASGSFAAMDSDRILEMVQDAVRREVAPLRREIMALQQKGPGITEILGGIGYIVGLAALGALLLGKRRKTTN